MPETQNSFHFSCHHLALDPPISLPKSIYGTHRNAILIPYAVRVDALAECRAGDTQDFCGFELVTAGFIEG
jgi:hypothetical protein